MKKGKIMTTIVRVRDGNKILLLEVCPTCQKEQDKGQVFCKRCGFKLKKGGRPW